MIGETAVFHLLWVVKRLLFTNCLEEVFSETYLRT
jgi:hypothetical protein